MNSAFFKTLLLLSSMGGDPQAEAEMATKSNQFAFDLYRQLAADAKGQNVFFSPHSIHTALAMTAEGAEGPTLKEMQQVLHLPQDRAAARASYSELLDAINQQGKPYELATANAIWPDLTTPMKPAFPELIDSFYKGGVTPLDYKRSPEPSRETINAWVEKRTHDRIKNLIPKGAIDDLTRLVLTNAIYFKGDWLTAFDSTLTLDQPFILADGQTQTVKLMHTKMGEDQCRYNQTTEAQILELPYQGDELSMVLVLPFPGKMQEVERQLDEAHWAQWTSGLTPTEVNVHLPRFKLEQKFELNEPLKKMGMPTAFDPTGATFPNIFESTEPLYISAVIHQAFVEVKETGTEAAAATAVIIATWDSVDGTQHIVPTFRADHPFLFAIRHKATGAILFMGKMESPQEKR
jgi:serpin B